MTGRRAILFVTCLVDQIYPQIGLASAELLERHGVAVRVVPGALCCGQMGFNAGCRDDAFAVALRTLRLLNDSSDDVVIPSGSCAAMIRHLFEELFRGSTHAADAAALAARTFELTEYLVDVLGVVDVGARFAGRLAYHHACHGLRFLGLGQQAASLLAHVQGAEVVPLPAADECCGFGGLFAVKHADISTTMLSRKIAHAESVAADVLITGDASCMTHIAGGLSRRKAPLRARHIAELLTNRIEPVRR